MGNSQLQKSSFEQNNWRSIEEKQNRKILYNDITMKSVERHEAELDCDEGEAISMCKWRQSLPQESNIVDLYQFGIKKSGFCNKISEIYVITERIHLLQEIGSISQPEAFLILKNVACGLKVLFRKFGNFNPKPNTIGINNQGRAKVWVNQNFAISEPQKITNIPIPSSQFEIVNNVIRILEQKISDDESYPVDFPKNLDLNSAVNYVNKVFSSLRGFQIDRVYIDRAEFLKRHDQIKQRDLLDHQSRMRAVEAQKRLIEIQILRENLRRQQFQLAKRERQLILHSGHPQTQRQLQLQRYTEMQRQIQIHKHYQTKNNPMTVVVPHNNEIIQENSQGKILKKTVSTFKSDTINSRLIPPTNLNAYPEIFGQPNQNIQINRLNQFKNTHLINNFQHPVPIGQDTDKQPINQPIARPKNIEGLKKPPKPPLEHNRPQSKRKQNANLRSSEKIRKQIEMIDQMVMMGEDSIEENKDKKFVESRLITYHL